MSKRPIQEEQLVSLVLESMGVLRFEDEVLPYLVETLHKFSQDVLAEAFDHSSHAGRKTSQASDVKLALVVRSLAGTTSSCENLTDLASEVNKQPLPKAEPGNPGVHLPQREGSLLSRRFRIPALDEVSKHRLVIITHPN
mmetsp:Transcript_45598/g.92048  ORF Transcript_45598/g.92048 Transcript_45598/m.92048 type:complete len:140 (-) Transcript_45598:729-1148(-)